VTITVNGIGLYYEKTGAGAPLLLLHGNGEDHAIFDALAAKLSADFTVYALDSRNHGQSEKTDDYAYETMTADVEMFLAALGLADVYLAGFSDGAIIGLLLALRKPSAIRKMALLGVNLSPADFTDESLAFIRDTYAGTNDPLLKLMLEQPQIALDAVRMVRVPTLLLAAEEDVFKPESFERLAAAMPGAELQVIAGHDHGSYVIGNDMMYPVLRTFFR